jgi:hypothetical protein
MINHANRISKTEFAGFMLAGERTKSAARPTAWATPRRAEPPGLGYRRSLRRKAVALSIKACAVSLSSMLFITVAAAQTPHGPIVNGLHLQPTQEQPESTNDKNTVEWNRWNKHWIRWNNRVAPEIHRLYEEIMRAAPLR